MAQVMITGFMESLLARLEERSLRGVEDPMNPVQHFPFQTIWIRGCGPLRMKRGIRFVSERKAEIDAFPGHSHHPFTVPGLKILGISALFVDKSKNLVAQDPLHREDRSVAKSSCT